MLRNPHGGGHGGGFGVEKKHIRQYNGIHNHEDYAYIESDFIPIYFHTPLVTRRLVLPKKDEKDEEQGEDDYYCFISVHTVLVIKPCPQYHTE